MEDFGAQTVDFFHANGSKVFRRHALNDRVQMATRQEYRDSILAHGIVKDARAGKVYVVPDKLDRASWTLEC
eukprot:9914371-Alexandrium_andersonii.AAC.1